MNPTYQSGFYAPGRGTALHPELWRGCVGAWNPGLGNTGLSLRDWSGNQNNGTLTNFALTGSTSNWVPSKGGYALAFDGTNDWVSAVGPTLLSEISITVWAKSISTASQNMVTRRLKAVFDDLNYVFAIDSTKFVFAFTAASNNYHVWTSTGTASSLGVLDGNWHLLSAVFTYGTGSSLEIRVDGKAPIAGSWTSGTGNATHLNNPSETFAIGKELYSPSNFWNGQLGEMRIYNRRITPNVNTLLASRHGIAYERAPRKFYSLPAAAGNPTGNLINNLQSIRLGL